MYCVDLLVPQESIAPSFTTSAAGLMKQATVRTMLPVGMDDGKADASSQVLPSK